MKVMFRNVCSGNTITYERVKTYVQHSPKKDIGNFVFELVFEDGSSCLVSNYAMELVSVVQRSTTMHIPWDSSTV